VRITPVSPARLVDEIVEEVARHRDRLRVAVDGAPPSSPGRLAEAVAGGLRTRGRPVLVVRAADFLRPASVRLEHGHTDPDAFLEGWLDVGGLRREVLDPAAPDGSGHVLPRLWDARVDRAHRAAYSLLPPGGVVVVHGALLLGRALPFDVTVHLHMSAAALARTTEEAARWTLPAYARYDAEHEPARLADLTVMCDHADRPAVRWRR
jgi:hypothetical protein